MAVWGGRRSPTRCSRLFNASRRVAAALAALAALK